MSGSTRQTGVTRLHDELRTEFQSLDAACRRYGVTALMFRTAKFLFYIATLAVTVYLIQEASVAPTLAMAFAVLLISGPEGLETWLIHKGEMPAQDGAGDDGGAD